MLNAFLITVLAWITSNPCRVDGTGRIEHILRAEERSGLIEHSTRCLWTTEPATHRTPLRVHGGIGP